MTTIGATAMSSLKGSLRDVEDSQEDAPMRKKKRPYRVLERPEGYPKRPPSAYGLYVRDKHKFWKEQRPDETSRERTKRIAEEWSVEDITTKEHYKEKSRLQFQEYKEKQKLWEANHPEGRARIVKMEREVMVVRHPGKPKRPCSAYVLYANSIRHSVKRENPRMTGTDLCKCLAQKWKNLPKHERVKFVVQASEESKKYRALKKEYERESQHQQLRNDDTITAVPSEGNEGPTVPFMGELRHPFPQSLDQNELADHGYDGRHMFVEDTEYDHHVGGPVYWQ
uniref:HMG box domain-containing protein n=1 Tax=Palpitomonas bilix TaxID=652834 RepID=A0A7S3GKN9_9EUKA|mmetsp:Transcript_7537/g.19518  ORF Transcript_7537/g.19518 Transcript_7537/m.19518 type:complete len:282 (+) Transcript_7537:170-1015(+)